MQCSGIQHEEPNAAAITSQGFYSFYSVYASRITATSFDRVGIFSGRAEELIHPLTASRPFCALSPHRELTHCTPQPDNLVHRQNNKASATRRPWRLNYDEEKGNKARPSPKPSRQRAARVL